MNPFEIVFAYNQHCYMMQQAFCNAVITKLNENDLLKEIDGSIFIQFGYKGPDEEGVT